MYEKMESMKFIADLCNFTWKHFISNLRSSNTSHFIILRMICYFRSEAIILAVTSIVYGEDRGEIA